MDCTNIQYTYSSNMVLEKQGLIFSKFHCQIPVVVDYDSYLRIFVSRRDKSNRSEIVYLDVNSKKPDDVLFVSDSLVSFGDSLDKDGVMASCYIENKLFYTGWSKNNKLYHHSIFYYENGIKTLLINEEYLCSSPFVIKDNDLYKMWFISGKDCGWYEYDGKIDPLYGIGYAESLDCIKWDFKDVIFNRHYNEVFARPFVIKDGNLYKMWYSKMSLKTPKRYSMGYAESCDGINWERIDNKCIVYVSDKGWDSEMVAFPFICRNYLFYSGNGFGKAGFGYAKILS